MGSTDKQSTQGSAHLHRRDAKIKQESIYAAFMQITWQLLEQDANVAVTHTAW